jgi:hypothetical protein
MPHLILQPPELFLSFFFIPEAFDIVSDKIK